MWGAFASDWFKRPHRNKLEQRSGVSAESEVGSGSVGADVGASVAESEIYQHSFLPDSFSPKQSKTGFPMRLYFILFWNFQYKPIDY